MSNFVSRVKNLSQKAAELKAAIQSVPPKVAEIREAMTATTGQLQQLKSEIHHSVADLKADDESRLTNALQDIKNGADVLAKAGFVVTGLDLEISPVQRMLLKLTKVEDVHASVLRSLLGANQSRRTLHAILSSILQAKQMAETVAFDDLNYAELAVGIGPIPTVRLCWRSDEFEESPVAPAAATTASITPDVAASAPATQSAYALSSFFEQRASSPPRAATPVAAAVSKSTAVGVSTPEATPKPIEPSNPAGASAVPAVETDPLARFKKMPNLAKSGS